MKVSELIAELMMAQAKYGDVKVCYLDIDENPQDIEELQYVDRGRLMLFTMGEEFILLVS